MLSTFRSLTGAGSFCQAVRPCRLRTQCLAAVAVLGSLAACAIPATDKSGWIDLFSGRDLAAWKEPTAGWQVSKSVALDPKNPKKLLAEKGDGLLVDFGRGRNLSTKQSFTDVEVHAEFLVPKGSNSGIKLMGLYEIQIRDSFGVSQEKLTGDHCGGIYPRAEDKPAYHHIDAGFAPKINAAKPAGEWQTLDITFKAPRFDSTGTKIANAVFVRVVHNGQVVHENRDVGTPTGSNYVRKEIAKGPILLQGDHGPVAFRNIRVRELGTKE